MWGGGNIPFIKTVFLFVGGRNRYGELPFLISSEEGLRLIGIMNDKKYTNWYNERGKYY
jgi:hypothetical protein